MPTRKVTKPAQKKRHAQTTQAAQTTQTNNAFT